MSKTINIKRVHSANLQSLYLYILDDENFFLNSNLDENLKSEERIKKQIEFNRLSKIEYASFKEPDNSNKKPEINPNDQNVGLCYYS